MSEAKIILNSPAIPLFPKIALSLSGGGYRAASFHLGTLEMLDELNLLNSIKILSTVSGGTITGATYAASLANGISLKKFSSKLKSFLKSTNIIAEGLGKLSESVNINNSEKMPSLIRAAASVYALENLLGGRTLDVIPAEGNHIRDISFNTTDFRTGNSFRFQKSDSSSVYSGNRYAQIPSEINDQIRLADIVAASSCFPSGFEPIRFPGDFVWQGSKNLSDVRLKLGEKFNEDIPLMDGGIFDNQGIDSLMNINERVGQEIDLFIISDTDARNENLLDFPQTDNKTGMKIKHIGLSIRGLQIISLITILAILIDFVIHIQTGNFEILRIIFLYLIPFIFSAVVIYVAQKGRTYLSKLIDKFNEESGINVWHYLKNLTLPQLIEFSKARIISLISMSGSVFMKRIRDLSYQRLYADADIRDKVISNQIYDLNKKIHFRDGWSEFISEAELTASDKLKEFALQAETYKTNLWFLDNQELDNLINIGRATMCYNILDYLLEKKLDKIAEADSSEFDLFQRTKNIWLKINAQG